MRQAGLDLQPASAAYVALAIRQGSVTLQSAVWTALDRDEDLGAEDPVGYEDLGAASLVEAGGPESGSAPKGDCVLGLPGRDAIIRYVHLPPLPDWRLDLLMEDEVQEVQDKAGEPLCSDHCLLEIPDGMLSPVALDVSVLVALAKEEPVETRIRALERVGVSPQQVVPRPLALFNAWVGLGHVDDRPTLLVDVAPGGTELALTRDGLLLFARSLPAMEGVADEPVRAAGQLARAVQGSLSFARQQQQLLPFDLGAVRISGALSANTAALDALSRALKVEVTGFSVWERIDLEGADPAARRAVEAHGADLAIACGLALGDAHPRSVVLDLVPRAVKRRRRFWTRTAWMIGAAATLLVALGISGVQALSRRRSAQGTARRLAQTEADLQGRLDRVEQIERQNRELALVLGGLTGRAQAGAASAWLLQALRRAVPRTVTVQSVRLETGTDTGATAGAAPPKMRRRPPPGLPGPRGSSPVSVPATQVTFWITGEADNAAGEGTNALAAFERALRLDPQVQAAKVTGTPVERPGATLAFTLKVTVRPLRARSEIEIGKNEDEIGRARRRAAGFESGPLRSVSRDVRSFVVSGCSLRLEGEA